MSDIHSLIKMLQSENPNKRYDACEELRLLPSLPPEALEALRLATNDPNPSVADAAQRAIALHSPKKTIDVVQNLDVVESKKKSYAEHWGIRYIFAVLGFPAGAIWGFSLLVDAMSLVPLLIGGIIGAGAGWVIGKILESIIDYFINNYRENREEAK